MPQSAVQKNSHVYVGAMTQVKYGRRFYDAEILKVSCECFCFFFLTCSIYISRQGLLPTLGLILIHKLSPSDVRKSVGLPIVYCLIHIGDCRQFNKVCDSLINFETTREELLREADAEVDSTTEGIDSPVKKPKLDKKVNPASTSNAKSSGKKKQAVSKVEAAKSRAKEIFSQMAPTCSSDLESNSEDEMMKQVKDQQETIESLRKQLQMKCKL